MSRAQHVGQNHNINVDSNSFEWLEQHQQIKIPFEKKLTAARYHSVQNLLSSIFFYPKS